MFKLLFRLNAAFAWLRKYLSEADTKQVALYVLMILLLLYIASKLTGWLAVGGVCLTLSYGGFILYKNYFKLIIDQVIEEEKEKEQSEN